jgi:hypothetical protein
MKPYAKLFRALFEHRELSAFAASGALPPSVGLHISFAAGRPARGSDDQAKPEEVPCSPKNLGLTELGLIFRRRLGGTGTGAI